jgi:O-antigen/teichoic acid export membrane protein
MAKFIILILFGKPYQGAWEITYFLSIGTFLMSFGILIGAVLNGTGRMWDGLWLNCIWVILFVPLSFVLINELGLNGMGYSYVLSHLLYTGIMFMYTTKRLEIKLNGFKSLLVIAITFYLIGSIIIRRYDGINLIMTSGLIIMILISIEYLLLTPDEKKSICSLVSKTFHS